LEIAGTTPDSEAATSSESKILRVMAFSCLSIPVDTWVLEID
jgi:hypothetical protein